MFPLLERSGGWKVRIRQGIHIKGISAIDLVPTSLNTATITPVKRLIEEA